MSTDINTYFFKKEEVGARFKRIQTGLANACQRIKQLEQEETLAAAAAQKKARAEKAQAQLAAAKQKEKEPVDPKANAQEVVEPKLDIVLGLKQGSINVDSSQRTASELSPKEKVHLLSSLYTNVGLEISDLNSALINKYYSKRTDQVGDEIIELLILLNKGSEEKLIESLSREYQLLETIVDKLKPDQLINILTGYIVDLRAEASPRNSFLKAISLREDCPELKAALISRLDSSEKAIKIRALIFQLDIFCKHRLSYKEIADIYMATKNNLGTNVRSEFIEHLKKGHRYNELEIFEEICKAVSNTSDTDIESKQKLFRTIADLIDPNYAFDTARILCPNRKNPLIALLDSKEAWLVQESIRYLKTYRPVIAKIKQEIEANGKSFVLHCLLHSNANEINKYRNNTKDCCTQY